MISFVFLFLFACVWPNSAESSIETKVQFAFLFSINKHYIPPVYQSLGGSYFVLSVGGTQITAKLVKD